MSNQVFRQNLDDKKGPQPGGPYPVSYTHLDVYKRQVWIQRPGCGARTGDALCSGLCPPGGGAETGGGIHLDPVSYTHLDADIYEFDLKTVTEYRKKMLSAPDKDGKAVLEELIGQRKTEAEDDDMDWEEEVLGEMEGGGPVSYTHLDVYKRQELCCPVSAWGMAFKTVW